MAETSAIEWLAGGSTWNPFAAFTDPTDPTDEPKRGWFCIHVDDGCTNCYAAKMNEFRGTGYDYIKQNLDKHRFEIIRRPDSQSDINWPIRVSRPRRIFPCSMTDLFAEWHPEQWIDELFATMLLADWHTFIITTKQETRMVEYLMHPEREARIMNQVAFKLQTMPASIRNRPWRFLSQTDAYLPMRNVLVGVSISNQKSADRRRDYLRTIANDGWATWVSFEPALSPINWDGWDFLYWLVSGGESGVFGRPSHPDCHRGARDFAKAHDIKYFFKQWGKYYPVGRLYNRKAATPGMKLLDEDEGAFQVTINGQVLKADASGEFRSKVSRYSKSLLSIPAGTCEMLTVRQKQDPERKGNQKVPAILDGRCWHEFPKLNLHG